ncbi:MAG: M28 family peptidase [Balneolaceae bacterium]|nr:M28 family peptidase [Balneolaceae bacterium]
MSGISCIKAQTDEAENIRSEVKKSDIELNVHFLSSDELQGRDTGTRELEIAARYITSWFLSNDVQTAPGYDSYYQKIQVPRRDTSATIPSQNVIGVIEGSDPDLKEEYLLLSAHYDHVGIGPATAEGDSIYNGARDNAVGVATVMAAGKYFADHPPKRSMLLALWTAEEMGLIGSRMFVEDPAVPLEQIIYNLNIDGAGYNDTTKVTIVGLERTDAQPLFETAVQEFGLEAIPSPVPELNLFNRSDNVHFARKGIPAPTFSLGFTSFNEELQYFYHQPTDESDTVDFDYVTNYVRAYVLAAQKIANAENAPFWNVGDEYEEAGRKLYESD